MFPGFLGAVIWFAIFVALKWGYFHRREVVNRSKFTTRIFTICVFGNLASNWLLIEGGVVNASLIHSAICGFVTMACFFVVYMPFYYTIATSLSVQTLVLLAKNEDTLPLSDLTKRFTSENFVSARLEIMERNGYVFKRGGSYYLFEKGLLLSSIFLFVKKIWRLGTGG